MGFQILASSLFLTTFLLSQTCFGVPVDPIPEAQAKLGQAYLNFTAGVIDVQEKNDINAESESAGGIKPADSNIAEVKEAYADSFFGTGYILAVANEKIWPTSIPVFQNYLETVPKTLPESFELILNDLTKDSDVKVSNQLFTSEKAELTPGLTKLKLQVVNTDLKSKDAVSSINIEISKALVTPLESTYIPKDDTISPAAKALLVNTLHVTGDWPTPGTKVPSGTKFNGQDDVEMIELKGKFKLFESKEIVEVIIPFKNEKRAISLILPKDISEASSEDESKPLPVNTTSVRVQLPIFKLMLRALQSNGSSKCDFKKEENVLQFLDEITYVSLDQEKFEAISIAGAQFSNANSLKQELMQSKGRAIPSVNSGNSTNHIQQVPAPGPSATKINEAASAEKLIVFNKPFTWTLLDINLGPLFRGSVESLGFLKTASTAAATEAGVFGMKVQPTFATCL